jgi:PAS domain S-box/diguanylate cyclase (GGDEF) domain
MQQYTNKANAPARLDARAYKRILDAVALPLFATDKRGKMVLVNACACEMLGKTAEELLGVSAKSLGLDIDAPARAPSQHEQPFSWSGREQILRVSTAPTNHMKPGSRLTAGIVQDITSLRDTELACALNEKRMEILAQSLPVMILASNAAREVVFWNRECERVLGYPANNVLGNAGIYDLLFPEADYRTKITTLIHSGQDFRDMPLHLRAADGTERIVSWSMVSNAAPLIGWTNWSTGVDITAKSRAEKQLAESERRLRNLIQASPMGIHLYSVNAAGELIFMGANPSADRILGVANTHVVGQRVEKAFPDLADTTLPETFHTICTQGGTWKTEQMEYHDDAISGAYELHAFQTEPGHCACMFLDLTERKRMETRLRHLALHDPLTGAANRTLCMEIIESALQRAKRRPDYKYAVIFLDLDRFKNINDTLGHAAGDAVLIETAKRLKAAVRELDTVARLGGDEFVLVLEEFDSYKRPIQAIRRIRGALEAPHIVEGQEITVTASIGMAHGQLEADNAEAMLRNANLAMHRAKSLGRNRVKSFTPSLLRHTLHVVRMENEMDRAIAQGEFFLAFQPIIGLSAERNAKPTLFGFEALARWRHPQRGLIMPGEFIPVAEDSGKVVDLGFWALAEGSRILEGWRKRYPHLDKAMLSVNLSPQQVPHMDFLPRMRSILRESGLPSTNLKLEITETALMQSGSAVLSKLREIRDMGVSFSVDDFGTGYSSLAYLTRLPLDHLKIDLSFVRMLGDGQENLEIVRAIINLAQSLKLDVVAEGVETEAQLDILHQLGCRYFQGYLYSHPLPEAEAETFLARFATDYQPQIRH